MDKKVNRWAWLPGLMPGVARRMAELRRKHGDAFVDECWRRGVVKGEPDWFFAREGPIAIGTPPTDPSLLDVCGWQVTPPQALVITALPGGGSGA
jgi:hypothetical protein